MYGRIYVTAYPYVCNMRIASGLEYGVFDSKLAFWGFQAPERLALYPRALGHQDIFIHKVSTLAT